jgi:hypothetical protein
MMANDTFTGRGGLISYPPPLFGTSSHEEFRSSKFGTRWYVNAAAAPLLQQFENYYGASH